VSQSSEDPVLPTSLKSLDEIDDVDPTHKKSCPKKVNTNKESTLPNALADLFKQPVSNAPGYKWPVSLLL
jgi:hypothetical protein